MSENEIVVAVSPFYSGMGWQDPATNTVFKPTQKIEPYRISKQHNLAGIKNALRLNHLLLLEGSLEVGEELDVEALDPGMLSREQLKGYLENAQGGSAETEEELTRLRAENKQLVSEKDALTKEKGTLEGQVSSLTEEKNTLNGEVASLTQEKASLEGQVSTLSQEKEALELENADLKRQLEEAAEPAMLRSLSLSEEDLAGKTKEELKVLLDEAGIEYEKNDKKDALLEKLTTGA